MPAETAHSKVLSFNVKGCCKLQELPLKLQNAYSHDPVPPVAFAVNVTHVLWRRPTSGLSVVIVSAVEPVTPKQLYAISEDVLSQMQGR